GMAKEPDDRYGSAGALGRAANRALQAVAPTPLGPTEYAAPPQYPSWPPAPRMQGEPRPFPPMAPSTGPDRVISGERTGDRASWLVPTVVAVSAALVIGAVSVAIVFLTKLNSSPAPSAAPVTPMTFPGAAPSEDASPPISPVPMPSRPAP